MRYGLIAQRLGHSFSPEIHRAIGGYEYELRELPPEELAPFMRARDFVGINVTIPYKTAVIPYLDEVDGCARRIGAVNTVVNRGGKLIGYNTDHDGLIGLIRHAGGDPAGKKALILGSGGTAKTARAALADLGASTIVTVRRDARDGAVTYADAYRLHADAGMIVNTTPCGMFPHGGELPCDAEGAPLDLDRFPGLDCLFDVIYNPLRTALVSAARARGTLACGGLYMLVAQAVAASRRFTGVSHSAETTDRVFREILASKENIVLIGMPGCGKTTVGKLLSGTRGKTFCDTDDLIVRKEGKSIPAIFAEKGEAYFRELESAVVSEVSQRTGLVIATGGGAVLRSQNVDALKRNGRLFFIDRPRASLAPTDDRPLGDTKEKIERLYEERLPLYRAAADHTVTVGRGDAEAVAASIAAAHERIVYEC